MRETMAPLSAGDVLGDRWTLVIVRDLMMGKTRYSQFLESPERITTNVLADRLSRMGAAGLIVKEPYQTRPKRYAYTLTEKGQALRPVLQAICRWGNANYPETWVPPEAFMADMDPKQS